VAASIDKTAESVIRALLLQGEYNEAVTRTIRRYGPEILGMFEARLRDAGRADEAFAWFSEDLWASMKSFRGACSMRTWAHAVARNSVNRYVERAVRVDQLRVPLSQASQASALRVLPLTPDSAGQAEEMGVRIERLRAGLDEEEQTLLALRVDKGLGWREIALVFLYEGETPSEADLVRESARLRKRFQLLKLRLRGLASQLDS
jgi:RNA polymerase sigma-70 factor (ECF subfamily)